MSGRSRIGWPQRVVAGHARIFTGILIGAIAYFALPGTIARPTRGILAWDVGALALLVAFAVMFLREPLTNMRRNAEAQQEGEWTVFWITIAGAIASFAALALEFTEGKDQPAAIRDFHIGVVAATLILSWLVTHTLFALRYAHEFYETVPGTHDIARGLQFPSEDNPDYWDFVYFALVLGMTFQVSDVQITSRSFRRLATVHGLIGFLFNTVIVALTVNIAAGLL
jgi:uncharacterized membrane protein